MVKITSREELEEWLKDKPADWAQVISARVALRVLPYAFAKGIPDDWVKASSLAFFRATIISWAARNFPAYDMGMAAANADRAAFKFATSSHDIAYTSSASIASGAFAAATASTAIDSAALAVDYAVEAANAYAGALHVDAIWANINYDCMWLEGTKNRVSGARILTRKMLWLAGEADVRGAARTRAYLRLIQLDRSYVVWIDWYNGRIKGERAAFDIPGDKGRVEDKKILARLADATDEDFWGKGATYVNTTLQSWIDEARERVRPPPKLTTAEVKAAVVKYASPDARIVDDRLDAGPNPIFDKPRYDGDLATLPSQMRAFLGVLTKGLRNAPDIVRNCIAAYDDELLVRGTQPIVGTLKGLASAIATQIWITPDEADKDNPDAWAPKDAREWDAGTIDLLRTFFKTHIDLIDHFPLDPEREAMLAATPIDEVAASDKALTDPVDKVTELIIALAENGLATDNIVRIVKAHADYTRDIAGMPKPDEAQLPSTIVTPKRRHVLQTAGFYLHTYSILGTTVTLAAYPPVQALMAQLVIAAEQLLGFIL